MKLIDKLTTRLVRRQPMFALYAATYFNAHEAIRASVDDIEQPVSIQQINEAADDLAERMVDVAMAELDGAYHVLERTVDYTN